MQAILIIGRLLFVALIYLFLFRILTVLIADLQVKGLFRPREKEFGQLEVLNGTETLPKGRRFRVDNRGLSVGRGKNNDIIMPDHFVSLDHAVFRRQKGVTMLEDLGSTNGTWVNGERINSPVQLVIGDYVKIGSITFQYTRWQNENSKLQ
ncbi:FHA domain protein [Acididesulfobacillus acetoxydans]|uniref:FHA domain protein n=1 Tax=Acididesulfobacillus acetoxydans TaxID=1561005 RepID=A0A8S0XCR4_9FIRM|nr:FHA domain-containing protein [Acididesulfobacillus acetoxydans]CAA7602756.1 FHA domain protein [Acididesulfobacillus acetoxydans]CEJ06387.1 FHA domain-containing protein [Acididesulfobacillus acetoxydans]